MQQGSCGAHFPELYIFGLSHTEGKTMEKCKHVPLTEAPPKQVCAFGTEVNV